MRAAARLALAALVAAAAASCTLFNPPVEGTRYALVYGITRYTLGAGAGSSPNLGYPDADASAMATLLEAHGYQVTSRWVDGSGAVWHDGANVGTIGSPTADSANPPTITDPGASPEAPTRAVIEQDIGAMAATLGPNDTLVVYFSGHGMESPDGAGQWIIPYEGVAWFPADSAYYGNPASSIGESELNAVFAAFATHRIMLLLDTCNSGGFIGNTFEADALPPVYTGAAPSVTPAVLQQAMANYAAATAASAGLPPTDALVLAAAGRDESSYETDTYAHGIMTYFLLQAAGSADLNKDGVVTLLETYAFVKAGIDINWNASSVVRSQGETFAPHLSGGPVDFALF